MNIRIALVVLLSTLCFALTQAQEPRSPHGGMGGGMGRGMGGKPERLDNFRKMRLVELLHLKEDEAVRFFAKQGAHEETIGGLMKTRNDMLDAADAMAKEKSGDPELQKKIDVVLDIDQQIFAERQRFQKEMRGFLTPEQFVTFISFERNFGLQVRDALGKMRNGPGSMRREHD